MKVPTDAAGRRAEKASKADRKKIAGVQIMDICGQTARKVTKATVSVRKERFVMCIRRKSNSKNPAGAKSSAGFFD